MSLELIKRQIIKQGRLADLLWPLRSNGLYCFNFHRIGDANSTPFDPCVYSCSADDLEKYINFIKNNFRVINVDELHQIIAQGKKVKEKLALITFDDGYRDNYDLAYPILKKFDVPGLFFIATAMIESGHLTWWDEIAWHVKHCSGKKIKLKNWIDAVQIDEQVSINTIKKVLARIKSFPGTIEEQLIELRAISQQTVPRNLVKELFVTWAQIKEMSDNNISIGAHSHSHQILSTLPEKELLYELTEVKKLLEDVTAKSVSTISYPVGGPNTYNKSMFVLLDKLGYKSGFSFIKRKNTNLVAHPFDLGRFSMDGKFNELSVKSMLLSAEKVK